MEEEEQKDADILMKIGLNREFYTEYAEIAEPDRMIVLVNKYRQLPMEYEPCDLERICPEFADGELLLRHEARSAFETMCRCAVQDNIFLRAISTYRSYSYQKKVYDSKWQQTFTLEEYRKERDKVSARAGFSEHQTGLAVDINDLEQTFEATEEGKWLAAHAYRYGFILRYPKGKERITGYDFEPWHYRYLGSELAESVYFSKLTYDEYYIKYLASYE